MLSPLFVNTPPDTGRRTNFFFILNGHSSIGQPRRSTAGDDIATDGHLDMLAAIADSERGWLVGLLVSC